MQMKTVRIVCASLALVASQVYAQAWSEGWVLLPNPDQSFRFYYQPLSVQTQANGHVKVTSLINYSSGDGALMSLFTRSIYDCAEHVNLDVLTAQHEGHWAIGKQLAVSESKDQWRRVLPKSMGATLMAAACGNIASSQLQR